MKKYIMLLALLAIILSMPLSGWTAESSPFSGVPVIEGEFKKHTAKEGEDLYPIARSHGLAIEHLMFANGMTGIKTRPGQTITIPTRRIPPPVSFQDGIVLNLPERGLYLFRDGRIKKFFPVAIGMPGRWMTPTGDMKIITKAKDPTWIPPEWAEQEAPVPAGPDNPLGDRWMGLDQPGYGIHATNNPASIGLAASHGCMRMYPEMAHELFEKVYVGMPVKIIYEPIKLGYDPGEKRLYMEAYPDVYGKTGGLLEEAKRKLAQYNLLDLVDEARLKHVVGKARGIPELILGSDIVIKVNDQRQDLYLSPISKEGKIWVTSQVLKPIGAGLVWNNQQKSVDIYHGDKKVSLKVKRADGTSGSGQKGGEALAYLWQGRAIIPLGHVLNGLGINYKWLPEHRTILVYADTTPPGVRKPVEIPAAKPSPSPSASPSPTVSPSPEVTAPIPSPVPDDLPPAPEPSASPE
jgi:L,D-transpeptidase ErfK/SrfK